jgi:hypothetical protein
MRPRPKGLPRRIKQWWWRALKLPGRVHRPKSNNFWRWRAWRLGERIPKRKKPPLTPGEKRRADVVRAAEALVGIREEPLGSNSGPQVHQIQTSTGAFGAPWCVSTIQYEWQKAGLGTWAEDTAGAYFLEDYARRNGCVIPRPLAGCSVVYHLGDGHAGTVVDVLRNGNFYAVEGNWGNEVVRILRNPRSIPCTFVLRPELR